MFLVCARCGAENKDGRRFCWQCGSALTLACPSCGAAHEPHERFCGQCGKPLGSAGANPPAPEAPVTAAIAVASAERRLVSVLFADLVGFTALSEQRDAEEVRELLTRYFGTAREIISRYGGTVEKFIGDAVMAVWGSPVAHEDDAERAVRAALELTDAILTLEGSRAGGGLQLRAGVLTGEAAVTIGAEGQGMVAGDLVNTASRLQSAAPPGCVLVGEATYRAARNAVSFAEAGEHALKGKNLPVKAWRALRVVAGTGGFRRAQALEAPFVGRDDELRLMKDLFHTTARERRPRLVSVMGVGGIGKSRLAWEFFKYIDGFVETVYWHQGRCPAYGDGVAFWGLGEMVRMRARIVEGEDDNSSRAKLSRALDEHVADPDERRWIHGSLAHLLGLEDRESMEREELFAAWRTFFERISDKGPTVLLFEDLHWADSGLIEFIEHVLTWARSQPIFIVTLARPELSDKRPSWGAGQRNFISLYLEPLPDDPMSRLLRGLAPGLPEELVAGILERAEGVPLYAVETVRMLVDQGRLVAQEGSYGLTEDLTELEIPETLHSLIASRLDVLSAEDRKLLEDASILGKAFTRDALAALMGQDPGLLEGRLKELVRRELLTVEADPRSPERGQYGFVQSLIQEVAYQTLSKHDRFSRHVAAAAYFESVNDEELASVVASHYIEAYRAAPFDPQAEEVADKARNALLSAADRASSLGAHGQALGHIEQALLVATAPADQAVLWERAAASARNAVALDAAESYLIKAIEWHEQQGDRPAVARATAGLAGVLMGLGRSESAIEKLESAIGELQEMEVDRSLIGLMNELSLAYLLQSEPERSFEWADQALRAAERLDLVSDIVDALITKGLCLQLSRRWREALVLLTGALALAERQGLVLQQTRALFDLSFIIRVESPREAGAAARKALDLARRLGLREWELLAAGNACECAMHTGEWDWAAATIREMYGPDLPAPSAAHLGGSLVTLLALRGQTKAAGDELAAMGPLAESSTDPQLTAQLLMAEAWLALSENRLEVARDKAGSAALVYPGADTEVLSRALSGRAALWLGDRQGVLHALEGLNEMNAHAAWFHCVRRTLDAGLAALEGRRDESVTLHRDAARGYRDLSIPFDLALSHLDQTILLPAEPEARASAAEARGIFERLGAKPLLARLEKALAETDSARATG